MTDASENGAKPSAPMDKNTSKKQYISTLLPIGLMIAIFIAIRAYMQKDIITGDAPDINGYLTSGHYVSLSEMTATGQPVLIYFWATWCPICKAMDDSIIAIQQDYQVIPVAMQSGTYTQVRQFLQKNELNLPSLVDEKGLLAGFYGIKGTPTSLIIDTTGKIAFVELGLTTEIGLRARLKQVEP